MEQLKAAVIGSPINHSLSPFIFSFIAWKENKSIDYNKFEVTEEHSQDFLLDKKAAKSYVGFNVTLPLKECFLNSIDEVSPEVKALGALNVLHFNSNKISGHNTDIIGITNTFLKKNFSIVGTTCFLLGAGGSARAVAYVLGKNQAKKVIICNRSDRNIDLVKKFQKLFPQTSWSAVSDVSSDSLLDLIVNTTPLGMTGKESGNTFFEQLKVLKFNQKALAFDLIYTPVHTPFMKVMESNGLSSVCGLGMLIDQALATWKIWIGDLKDEEILHDELRDYLNGVLWLRQKKMPIYLTGFMGVGKSTIGAILAKQFNFINLDTDTLIEAKESQSVSEVFATKGEAHFRKKECETVLELSSSTNANETIISLGGGALVNENNLKVITDSGLLIYLSAEVKNILARVSAQEGVRPLLANLNEEEKTKKITELLAARKIYYQKAPIEIPTDHLGPEEICFNLISSIGKWQTKDHS